MSHELRTPLDAIAGRVDLLDLLRAMGGDIAVEGRVGSGSTFALSLPRATALTG